MQLLVTHVQKDVSTVLCAECCRFPAIVDELQSFVSLTLRLFRICWRESAVEAVSGAKSKSERNKIMAFSSRASARHARNRDAHAGPRNWSWPMEVVGMDIASLSRRTDDPWTRGGVL
jgi:hypothetical protein